jgi:hypothetical protein
LYQGVSVLGAGVIGTVADVDAASVDLIGASGVLPYQAIQASRSTWRTA